MRNPLYQPDRGDLIWLDFTPFAGTEQSGRRPALVLSPLSFNVATGLAFVCPVTSKGTGGSFEVPLPPGAGLTGFVLSDHLRSLDWVARNAAFAGKADQDLMWKVFGRIEAVLGIET
ncbi:MAG: type II toxin-antitoxin system PemK/MazF family toxin [Paracoccaceae bacterium]